MTSLIKVEKSYPDDICGICRDSLMDNVWVHNVHRFHGRCVASWVKDNPSCPTCRVAIDTTSLLGFKALTKRETHDQSTNRTILAVVGIVLVFCTIPTIYDFSMRASSDRCLIELSKKLAFSFFVILGNACALKSI